MPIHLSENLAVLTGVCEIEEAETLYDWLHKTASPQIDLSQCQHMHTAVLQTLLAVRPTLLAMPPDHLNARILAHISDDQNESC